MSDEGAAGDPGPDCPGRGGLTNCHSLDLILLGGLVIRAPRDLLKKCPFFENMFNSSPGRRNFRTKDSGIAVKAFLDFLRGVVPYPENAFDFVKFGLRIRFPAFVEVSALNAQSFFIPSGISSKSAIPVSKTFIGCLPTRRFEAYEVILRGVETECNCEQREYLESIMDGIREKCNQACQLPSVPLFEKKLTLAMLSLVPGGIPEMAALIRGEWEAMPIRCSPDLQVVRRFHVVFEKFFIYSVEPDNKVYVKDLSTDEPAAMFCEAAKIFRSHFGNLVVVTVESNTDSVYIWSDSRNKFEKVFANPKLKIRNVSWPRDSRNLKLPLRILTEDDKVISIDQTGRYLAFSENSECIIDWVDDLYLVRGRKAYQSRKDSAEVLPVAEMTHVGFSRMTMHALDRELGVYQTLENRTLHEHVHGKVIAISDVYLGIDHIDPHAASSRNS